MEQESCHVLHLLTFSGYFSAFLKILHQKILLKIDNKLATLKSPEFPLEKILSDQETADYCS